MAIRLLYSTLCLLIIKIAKKIKTRFSKKDRSKKSNTMKENFSPFSWECLAALSYANENCVRCSSWQWIMRRAHWLTCRHVVGSFPRNIIIYKSIISLLIHNLACQYEFMYIIYTLHNVHMPWIVVENK